ncbi:MAG: flagellar biosynthesis anti-sigma factor FlgM [Defluviitaleaceae bacterium]|nr:flagellar biosynthesis anti-sigma factor FlgM [Defluviitaleaceae bacterium]
MRINNIANIYETASAQQSAARAGRAGNQRPEARRDSLEVSDSARSFTTAFQAIANAPEVREGLVSDIRARIENGTYEPDPRRIAEVFTDERSR